MGKTPRTWGSYNWITYTSHNRYFDSCLKLLLGTKDNISWLAVVPDPGETDMASYGPFQQLGQVEIPQQKHYLRNLNHAGKKLEGVPLCELLVAGGSLGKFNHIAI